MAKRELQDMLEMFADGNGFGDPKARRNAELQYRRCWPSNNRRRLLVLTS